MILLFSHIVFALLGIVFTALALFRPSPNHVKTVKTLLAGTFVTGSALVVLHPASLPSACVSGLVYFSAEGLCLAAVKHRLAKQTNR